MASMVIEEESGTVTTTRTERPRLHNGYSAGRFAEPSSPEVLAAWFAWGRSAATAR
ncbi:MAG TPA: hypothetical protein VFK52_07535 [Nocardioidaceae bacterium]|nr:hypothetical protein [Nocardioidaceae bacterium]